MKNKSTIKWLTLTRNAILPWGHSLADWVWLIFFTWGHSLADWVWLIFFMVKKINQTQSANEWAPGEMSFLVRTLALENVNAKCKENLVFAAPKTIAVENCKQQYCKKKKFYDVFPRNFSLINTLFLFSSLSSFSVSPSALSSLKLHRHLRNFSPDSPSPISTDSPSPISIAEASNDLSLISHCGSAS